MYPFAALTAVQKGTPHASLYKTHHATVESGTNTLVTNVVKSDSERTQPRRTKDASGLHSIRDIHFSACGAGLLGAANAISAEPK